MNLDSLITLLKNEIENIGYKCYSPDLPQTDEICIAISVGQGTNLSSLNSKIIYSDIPFSLLIRGTFNDKETRHIADNIFNRIHHKEHLGDNVLDIIIISCATPNYAFRDENQRIYYNINCTAKVQWKEEP